LISTITL